MPSAILQFRQPEASSDLTVREVVGLYWSLEAKIEERRSKAPWLTRKRLLDEFVLLHGDKHVSQCKKHHLKAWIAGNPNYGSNDTRGRVCRTVQRAFNCAVDDEYIAFNPFRGVRFPKGKRRRALTEAEFQALVAATDKPYGLLLRLARLSGARPQELRDATWAQLQVDRESLRGAIILQEHKTCDAEDAAPRVIALPPEAVRELVEQWQAVTARHLPGMAPDHIFLNSRGRPWTRSAVCKRLRELRFRLGLPDDAKLYGLRHKFATDAIINGLGIKDVADLLGHRSTKTTEHYLHTAGLFARQSDLAAKAVGATPAVALAPAAIPATEPAPATLPFVAATPAPPAPSPAGPETPDLFAEFE